MKAEPSEENSPMENPESGPLFEPCSLSDNDDDFPMPFSDEPPPSPSHELPWNISLRLFTLDDVNDFMAWASDERVSEFSTWDTFTRIEEAQDYIIDHVIPHPWYRAICMENRPIGSIFVSPGSGDSICRGELGYHLGFNYRGLDIDTLAVKMVTADIFREFPHLGRLQALVDVDDVEPQKVFEKAGFMREGVMSRYLMVKGKARDMVVYGFMRDDPIERLFIFRGED